jgi:hypothetical protein
VVASCHRFSEFSTSFFNYEISYSLYLTSSYSTVRLSIELYVWKEAKFRIWSGAFG